MKVLEAMALGKAVVTTPRGAEGLAVDGREPPLVIGDGARGVADAALSLLADPARRRALGDAARAFVEEHHGSAAYAHRLERIYRDAAVTAERDRSPPRCDSPPGDAATDGGGAERGPEHVDPSIRGPRV